MDRGSALQGLGMLLEGLGSAVGKSGQRTRGLKAEVVRMQDLFLQQLDGPEPWAPRLMMYKPIALKGRQ